MRSLASRAPIRQLGLSAIACYLGNRLHACDLTMYPRTCFIHIALMAPVPVKEADRPCLDA
ncbi:MAG: hypothetical protein EBS41_01225 [Actinobacteria bacterium]|nr:hypothetical protein [Actinomycetota bacterium]